MPGRCQRLLVVMSLCLSAAWVQAARPSAAAAAPQTAVEASADARYAVQQVVERNDHAGRPFAVVDKRHAQLYLFDGQGRLLGDTPVLLGLMPGDAGLTDLNGRDPHSLQPAERTTPAGRFETEPGLNDKGEPIVWLDYGAALAIHRLRPAPAAQRRPARLASPDPRDRRISLGCVVVPVSFYEQVIAPTLGRQRGVVYVLPEQGPVQALFRRDDMALGGR